jgi:septal ring factor EnvC (AmiA/AmiB activator)
VAILIAGIPVPAGATLVKHVHRVSHRAAAPASSAAPESDLSGAMPAAAANGMPSTTDQYRALKNEMAKSKPAVESAKLKSDMLIAQAAQLRRKLADTATRVEALEEEKGSLDSEIAHLATREVSLSVDFSRGRVQVAHLLAVLERLQHDMPPILALKPDDALGAARGAMLLGASLPRIYGAAAELGTQLETLRATRVQLIARRAEGTRNAVQLGAARIELDQLLAMKDKEADEASSQYSDLQAKYEAAATEAADLGSLLRRVAALRSEQPPQPGIVVVAAQNVAAMPNSRRGSLLKPVIGRLVEDDGAGVGGVRAPGLTFLTAPGAQVVAPGDSEVLFAGPYHKTGQVLILESAGGYDLVLAGLERIEVRIGDQLLAGEPVGAMPRTDAAAKLYFELRQNGKGVSPAPWLEIDLRKAKRT